MTTYDELWIIFMNKVKLSDIDVPSTPDKIYDAIHGAVLSFNNRLRDSLDYDDTLETLSRTLNNDDLLILAHFIRIDILSNQLIYFTNVWQPFARDISIRNFSAQLKSLESLVEREEKLIEKMILNTQEDYI